MEIPLRLIGHKETVELEEVWNDDRTEIVSWRKVPGSNRTWVILKTESGSEIQIEVVPSDFDDHVLPLLEAYGDSLLKAAKSP